MLNEYKVLQNSLDMCGLPFYVGCLGFIIRRLSDEGIRRGGLYTADKVNTDSFKL